MTEDPVRQLMQTIHAIRDKTPTGWTAKQGSGGTWTVNGPGKSVRVQDAANPDKAEAALARLEQAGAIKALIKIGEAKPSKRTAKKTTGEAGASGPTPPAYEGDPSPDEGPVRRRVMLTPTLARELLGRPWEAITSEGISLRQRDLKDGTVDFFADLINRNKFQLTYQGCGIGLNGSLYDGQHRAHAVIRTGKSVEVWMNYNMHPDEIDGLDGGRQRRTSTRLSMEGYEHALLLGSSAKLLYNVLEWEAMPEEAAQWQRWYLTKVSDPVRRDLVHSEPALYESVLWTAELKQPRGPQLNTTAIAVFRFLVHRQWPEGAAVGDAFLLAAATGLGIPSLDHEAVYLRDWVARTANKQVVGRYCGTEAHLVLLICSWNRYIKGQPAKKIPAGLWPEFPTLYTP
jgi:hypothetical protein